MDVWFFYQTMFLLFTTPWCGGRVRHGKNKRSEFPGVLDLTEEDRLIKHILKKYEHRGTYSRPVEKYTDVMSVEFGLQLIQIIDLDEKEQVLTLNVWVDHLWRDRYLTWNVTEYKGVADIHLPPSKIWTPDIKLYNYADERLSEYRDALCIVTHDGNVTWLPQAVFKSQCNIDVGTFPFDKQNCTLKFSSWTYNGYQLDLNFKGGNAQFIMNDYELSNVWEVIAAPARRNSVNYACCAYPFIDLTFELVIRRRATFYANILILPCVLLTSLTLVLFWIPPESPAKMMLGYADKRLAEYRDALCIITPDGYVTWLPQAVFKSQCNIDVGTFPFDKQTCRLKFGSWTYNGYQLDLRLKSGKQEFIMGEYQESNVWSVIAYPAKRNIANYSCCNYPFIDLTFELVIRRRATFFASILIMPCVLLTSLTLVLFWIPPESPAKMQLGMTLFMAFFILLILYSGNMTPTEGSVPVLGTYYCLNMVLITLSSFLNVFVVNMTFFGARAPVPYALKKVMFTYVARMLCMENLVLPFMNDAQASKPHFMGVNSENKWSNDWRGSNECLLTSQKDITENHTQLAQIHTKVVEIRNFIKLYKERLEDKDRKEKVTKEWKALALVFDRIFFIIYFTTIVVSLSIVIPFIFYS